MTTMWIFLLSYFCVYGVIGIIRDVRRVIEEKRFRKAREAIVNSIPDTVTEQHIKALEGAPIPAIFFQVRDDNNLSGKANQNN